MQFSPIKAIAQEQLKNYIFEKVGITQTSKWKDKTVSQVLVTLRENAGLSEANVGAELDLTRESIRLKETAARQKDIDLLLPVIEPHLRKLAGAGWLEPNSFTINESRYYKVADICRNLRIANNMLTKEFDAALKSKGMEQFNAAMFEKNPKEYVHSYKRSVNNLISIVERLCQFYGCNSLDELIIKDRQAKEYNELQFQQGYSEQEKKDIGKAFGAMLNFLGLKQDAIIAEGIFSFPAISYFIHGQKMSSSKTIDQIPGVIIKAYKKKNDGEDIPEFVRFLKVQGMKEKGLQLAELDIDHLRVAVRKLMSRQGKGKAWLARESEVSTHSIFGFISPAQPRDIGLHSIHKLGIALGVPNIFELERIGRDVANAQLSFAATLANGSNTGFRR